MVVVVMDETLERRWRRQWRRKKGTGPTVKIGETETKTTKMLKVCCYGCCRSILLRDDDDMALVVVVDDLVGLMHLLGSSIAVWRVMGSVQGKWGPRIVFIGVMLHMSVRYVLWCPHQYHCHYHHSRKSKITKKNLNLCPSVHTLAPKEN